jgi:hypothetical protein
MRGLPDRVDTVVLHGRSEELHRPRKCRAATPLHPCRIRDPHLAQDALSPPPVACVRGLSPNP